MEYRVDVRALMAAGIVERGEPERMVCLTVLPRAGGQHAKPPPGIEVAFGHAVAEGETYWVMQNGVEDVAFAASKIETIVLVPALAAVEQDDCPADIVAMAAVRQAQLEGAALATRAG